MTESERLKLHIWSLHESRDGPTMAELRHVIAGMVAADYRDDLMRYLHSAKQHPLSASERPMAMLGHWQKVNLGF